jgi:glycyl-tRNA synthetase beta chain
LRRQAQGLISILVAADLRLDLPAALAFGLAQMPTPDPAPKGALDPVEAQAALLGFFATRIEAALQEEGLAYDTVRAVLGSTWTEVVDVIERGRALHQVRGDAGFEAFVDTATRPANIWRNTDLPDDAAVDDGLFEHETERALWAVYQVVRARVTGLKQAAPVDYVAVWAALGELQRPISELFDAVMVNAEDPALRRNRLAMMRDLDRLYLELADFREVVQ